MSNTKIFKFGFIADIKTVTLALKFPCIVSVYWKRGQKTAQIKQRKQINQGVATFNEKLEIQCNMNFDTAKQVFQEKKTKFTVVIFSDKGTKQAGEVYVDVAELLNSKSKKLTVQKNLDKCPDKNAKLTIELSGYMKQQITPEAVSQKSNKSNKQILPQNPSTVQPNFKKKNKQVAVIQGNGQDKNIQEKAFREVKTENNSAIPVTKQNIPKVQMMALQQQNKKLKTQLRALKDLQIQNQTLKRQYDAGQKKSYQYYSSKYDEIKLEYTQMKEKLQKIKGLQKNKESLQIQLYENKDRMAKILNFAVDNKMNQFAQELTNIYSSED